MEGGQILEPVAPENATDFSWVTDTDYVLKAIEKYKDNTRSKSATESGINVGDRALPVNLDLDIANVANTGQEAARFDIFAMCDCIIYIDLAGKVTTRI